MRESTIIKRGLEIAEQLFKSPDLRLSKEEIYRIISNDGEEYYTAIINGVTGVEKICNCRGSGGGIEYLHKKNGRASLTKQDRLIIQDQIKALLKKRADKSERKKPESAVEVGFFEYLRAHPYL